MERDMKNSIKMVNTNENELKVIEKVHEVKQEIEKNQKLVCFSKLIAYINIGDFF